jgi:hypothetical protein
VGRSDDAGRRGAHRFLRDEGTRRMARLAEIAAERATDWRNKIARQMKHQMV